MSLHFLSDSRCTQDYNRAVEVHYFSSWKYLIPGTSEYE